MRLKIDYVHGGGMPAASANSVNIAKMCAAFAALGHEVRLLLPGARADADGAKIAAYYDLAAPFEVERLGSIAHRAGFLAALSAAKGRMRRTDLVYTRSPRAASFSARIGLPSGLEIHSPVVGARERPALQALIRSRNLRGLVCVSDALKQQVCADFELTDGVFVAHSGADPAADSAAHPSAFDRRRMLVGYAGHLYPGKGMEIVVPLARSCPWADFQVVGGREEDVERWRRLSADVSNLKFAGAVPHSEIGRHVAAFDVVLAPYLRAVIVGETPTDVSQWMSPLKIFEYMAAGKAIVSSDLPVLREVLSDERTALLCNPDDVASWATALQRLHADEALRASLGAEARRRFLSAFTWEKRAERILSALGFTAAPSESARSGAALVSGS